MSKLDFPRVRPVFRIPGPKKIAARNKEEGRKGVAAFETYEVAIEAIASMERPSATRIESWISHPDERVVAALVRAQNERYLGNVSSTPFDLEEECPRIAQDSPSRSLLDQLGERALTDAREEGVEWTPVLDLMEMYDGKGFRPASKGRVELQDSMIQQLGQMPGEEVADWVQHLGLQSPALAETLWSRAVPFVHWGRGPEQLADLVNTPTRLTNLLSIRPLFQEDVPWVKERLGDYFLDGEEWKHAAGILSRLRREFPESVKDGLTGGLEEQINATLPYFEAKAKRTSLDRDDHAAYWGAATAKVTHARTREDVIEQFRQGIPLLKSKGAWRFMAEAIDLGLDGLDTATFREVIEAEGDRADVHVGDILSNALWTEMPEIGLEFLDSYHGLVDEEEWASGVHFALLSPQDRNRGDHLCAAAKADPVRARELLRRLMSHEELIGRTLREIDERPELLAVLTTEDLVPALSSGQTELREKAFALLDRVGGVSKTGAETPEVQSNQTEHPRSGRAARNG